MVCQNEHRLQKESEMKFNIRIHKFMSGKTGIIFEIVFNRVLFGAKTHGIAIFKNGLTLSFGMFYKEFTF